MLDKEFGVVDHEVGVLNNKQFFPMEIFQVKPYAFINDKLHQFSFIYIHAPCFINDPHWVLKLFKIEFI